MYFLKQETSCEGKTQDLCNKMNYSFPGNRMMLSCIIWFRNLG